MRKLVFLGLLSYVFCTLDDLVNGLTGPAVPMVKIIGNMSKPLLVSVIQSIS